MHTRILGIYRQEEEEQQQKIMLGDVVSDAYKNGNAVYPARTM